jgi:hypothetical protein
MTNDMTTIIFIQSQDRHGITEVTLKESATFGDLYEALTASGVPINTETFIFIDEAEEHLHGAHPRHALQAHQGNCALPRQD